MPHASSGAPGSASAAGKVPANPVASAGGKPPPFWANWGQQWNNTSQNMRQNAATWVRDMEVKAKTIKGPKWEMPVHVDVDFFNPFMSSVKQTAVDAYRRLPPQAQLALPFVATGATTGLIVGKIQGGRIRKQREKIKELETRIEALLDERDTLKGRIQQLKAKALAPNSASEMRMAHAVAEATAAAAAAASAAASAASACQVNVHRPARPQPQKLALKQPA